MKTISHENKIQEEDGVVSTAGSVPDWASEVFILLATFLGRLKLLC